MRPDIRSWRDIDAPWLSAALQEGGVDAKVASFTAKPVGTGQIGDCVRFSLTYARAEPGAPASLVGKFPSEGEESRQTGIQLGNYHREVKFYQVLQPEARISTPRCYFTEVDEATHDFVLIMGDLAPAEQGDQLAGATMDEAHTVMREGAKLHAAFWQDRALDQYPWVSGTTNAPDPIQPDLVEALWHGFVDRYGSRVTPAAKRIGDVMSVGMDKYGAIRKGPRCLIHCDFRPDNMLFGTPEGGAPLTVVDWQSFAFGPGASDIGYFIAGAIDIETRRKDEAKLLDTYLEELAAQGVSDYLEADFRRHYVSGAFQHFFTAYFAAMLVTQTPRGDDMFFRMLNGAVDLIVDYDAVDWLG